MLLWEKQHDPRCARAWAYSGCREARLARVCTMQPRCVGHRSGRALSRVLSVGSPRRTRRRRCARDSPPRIHGRDGGGGKRPVQRPLDSPCRSWWHWLACRARGKAARPCACTPVLVAPRVALAQGRTVRLGCAGGTCCRR
jgi:hypothetical protein